VQTRHFDREIVVLCVRWYLSFKLSYRDLVAMMIERGIDLAHTTILRRVQYYSPEFEKRWNRYAQFCLSRTRDVNAARTFLRRAIKSQRMPTKTTLDAYAASHRAVADLKASGELPKRVGVRSNKYLNNLIEQDHRRVKQRLRPMLGLKSFRTAAVVISGIELAEKIKKGQYNTPGFG
jgi:transposase-like protein